MKVLIKVTREDIVKPTTYLEINESDTDRLKSKVSELIDEMMSDDSMVGVYVAKEV